MVADVGGGQAVAQHLQFERTGSHREQSPTTVKRHRETVRLRGESLKRAGRRRGRIPSLCFNSRHSRPCGGNPSFSRKCGRGGPPAVRLRCTCKRTQGFPPQGRE
ncbi:hypothetical protein SGCZBJ_00360 [Caulobacter zeae]|uniref:Uncharacterized protein n=1 Tax=Caulobacter zeae TaxID=2055137 RepID=A0A2N5DS87_9CAUL|nr:hypothetical protein SGCZBJ_00360 [Caulobacter zeae]